MRTRLLFFIFISALSIQARSNDTIRARKNSLAISFQPGYIGNPDYNYSNIITGYPKAFLLAYEWEGNCTERWQEFYNYPSVGIALQHIDLGSAILGNIHCITPYISFGTPIYHPVYVGFKMGLGLAYVNNPFNRTENYKNKAIGSHINVNLFTAFELRVSLSPKLTAFGGVGVQHFSNGNTVVPNWGINLYNLHTGVSYAFRENTRTPNYRFFDRKQYELSLITTASLTNQRPNIQPGFHYFNLMLEGVHIHKKSLAYGIGFDYTANNADTALLRMYTDLPETTSQAAVKAIAGALFGNFEMYLQPGIIFYPDKRYFSWLAFKYRITPKIKADIHYRYYFFNGNHLSFGLCFTII